MTDTDRKKRKYGNKPREDKSTLKIPKCPFCDSPFEKPRAIWGEFTEFIGGKCACGAVYICDETGKNLGETLMDGLVFACDNDWDRAQSLEPEIDYNEFTMSYDNQAHVIHTSVRQRMRGKLIFIKLNG
ncbi:MAG: hypothetical protein V3V59_08390, partial [Thermodesulfovibrionales bacterium]